MLSRSTTLDSRVHALPLEHRARVRNRADQFRLLVRSEQPPASQLPVYREHDLGADAWHRLQVDGSRVLALVTGLQLITARAQDS